MESIENLIEQEQKIRIALTTKSMTKFDKECLIDKRKEIGDKIQEKTRKILEPIFISRDEALEMKEKTFNFKIKELKLIKKENKELLSAIGNIENKIGTIMRKFELKNPPTDLQKEYMNKFWKCLIKEIPLSFSNRKNNYESEEEKKVNKIKYYRDKIKELENDALENTSESQGGKK